MSFFRELKRRNVFRVGIAYLLIAWVLLQGADFVLDLIDAPNWVIQVLALLAGIGWLAGLIFAWVYEVTPEGIRRESQIDRSQSITRQTGRKLDRVIFVFLVLAVVVLLIDRFSGSGRVDTEKPQARVSVSGPATEQPAPPDQPGGRMSIAVLPFVNMSSDPEQEYFSDGITEEILNRLAGIRELQVAARTSAFSFKGQNQDVREIAQLLGVGNVLEGSVRKSGDQVRITAQLIRASDGFHLWSEAYDRKLENIFAIQEDIASQIAEALQISLGIEAWPGQQSARLVNPEVYDLYLRARALHRARGPGLLEAIDLFEQALAIDPDFAPAWAGLSHSYIVVVNYVTDEELQMLGDVLAKSLAAAERALQLDPNLPTALHAMANNLFFQYEWAKAEEYYQRALRLDPDSADMMEDYTALLTYSWRLDAAAQVADRMVELDPHVPIFLLMRSQLYYTRGDFEVADSDLQMALEISPDFGFLQVYRLARILETGDLAEARRYATQMTSNFTRPEDQLMLVEWMTDARREPGPEVKSALKNWPTFALLVDRYDLWIEAVDTAGAEWPEWELTATMDLVAPVVSAERLQEYRGDPRTKALLRRLRLPEYWRQVGWPKMCRPMGDDDFTCG